MQFERLNEEAAVTEIKPDEKLSEVMRRTMANLRFIHEHRTDAGPYEVVQLVNSFSGAMAHPWEEMKRLDPLKLRKLPLQTARDREWPVLERELETDEEPKFYGTMLRWIRNGFAHGNVDFGNLNGQIATIRIENRPDGENRNWGTVATIEDLEHFLHVFQDLAAGREPSALRFYPRIVSHAAD